MAKRVKKVKAWEWVWWYGSGRTTTGGFCSRSACEASMAGYAGKPLRIRSGPGSEQSRAKAILRQDAGAYDCLHMRGCCPKDWEIALLARVGRVVFLDSESGMYSVLPKAILGGFDHLPPYVIIPTTPKKKARKR